ncbi:MAG TPA: transglycosylase domain-containing protein [Candidatus Saccharimonadales bacterium]|nr:transglycosylase domain-containing protein [Candidatus Saccharimonadales bacterium]
MSARRKSRAVSLYSNLSSRRKSSKDRKSRRRAEYLATLPKHPVKRAFYRLHPKRFFAFWFSREGAIMALKIFGVGLACMAVLLGSLFFYYRHELNAIGPAQLAKRVQSTVTKYYDRNGVLLWEDKGTGNYTLVVKSDQISPYLKDATVAIEDKDFYHHGGISIGGIMRAAVVDISGGQTQGGSTLTQQLVKQVFLAEEADERGISGIPRKIKEAILAIEAERMYTKDQILTMYLNESPYGGRRNGAESAAQTYFGKHAKDLNIAESALLASIPQSPSYYDPYYALDHPQAKKDLLARQETTISYMREQGMITKEQAEEAKQVPILDQIKPASDQFKNVKAPHFVQMVKSELEQKLGKKVVGEGGLTVKTTLDYRVQKVVDEAMDDLFDSSIPEYAGFDNSAITLVDVQTGQILALRGSRDYDYPGYGAVNAATAYIQPGSSIKPEVYAALFKQRDGQNYGAGSILSDNPLPQSIYTTGNGQSVMNFDNRFEGNITIRRSLAESRNIPAIKAMYIAGRDLTIDTIHDLGDKTYCTQSVDKTVGLAAAIGGCGLKQTEHVNAYATLARLGKYEPVSSVLQVKNSAGQIIEKWHDEGKQVIDPQIPYIISDILSDDDARSRTFGHNAAGMVVPGVKTATKTGTSNIGSSAKDLWMMSYSPKVALGMWAGNHVPEALNHVYSTILGETVGDIMEEIHKDIFQPDGTWHPGQWFKKPDGIQKLTVHGHTDLFPSWFNKKQSSNTKTMTFDKVSKKLATDCTPDAARTDVTISYISDPVTKRKTYLSTEGYDPSEEDDVHECSNKGHQPSIGDVKYRRGQLVVTNVSDGLYSIRSVTIKAGGRSVTASSAGGGKYVASWNGDKPDSATVTVYDDLYYSATITDHNL